MSDVQSCSAEPLPRSTTQSECSPETQEGVRPESTADGEDAPPGDVQCPTCTSGGGRQLETGSTDPDVAHHEEGSVKGVEELGDDGPSGVTFVPYESELQLPHIMRLMKADLSEPYSIYTYRYFIHNWPNLCFLVGKNLTLLLCKCKCTSTISMHVSETLLCSMYLLEQTMCR